MALSPHPALALVLGAKLAGFDRWLAGLRALVRTCPAIIGSPVDLTAQTAAIVTVALPLPTLSAGLYRVSYSLRVTTAAGVSSNVQLTIAWTDGAVVQTRVGANLNGNTTADHDEDVFLVRADVATTITYATAYASNAAAAMNYSLSIRVESVP